MNELLYQQTYLVHTNFPYIGKLYLPKFKMEPQPVVWPDTKVDKDDENLRGGVNDFLW